MTHEWAEYLRLVRRLDDARAAEETRRTDHTDGVGRARSRGADLERRLDAQAGELTQLARQVRLPRPRITTTPAPAPALSPEDALDDAGQAATAAARGAGQVRELAYLAPLLPHWKNPAARNAVIYAVCAVVMLLVQLPLYLLSPDGAEGLGAALWAFVGLPVVSLFAGYLATGYLGRPRLQRPVAHAWEQPPETYRSPRLGALICFSALPAVFIVLIIVR